jgi:Ca-activated chloride channel family protein
MKISERMRAITLFMTLTAGLCACGQSQPAATSIAENNPPPNAASSPIETAATAAQSPIKVIYILDASGSMLARVGTEEKMGMARRVLKDSIAKLPDTTNVGLIAYGHRRKNDCADIELLSQLKPIDKAALAQQIDALKPSGMTPISNSLQQAFDVVRSQTGGGRVTVVLVSDGLETCKGDPCKLTRDAKQAGLDIVVHVIGFDVGKVEVAQLECVAQAGNGLYLGAENAEELAAALAGAVAPAATAESRLSVKAMHEGKLTDVTVRVFRAGTREEVTTGRTYSAAETNPRVLPLPAGTYDVEVQPVTLRDLPARKLDGIKIAAGETVERTISFGTGELAIEVTRNGKLSDASITIYKAGTKQQAASSRSYTQATHNPAMFRIEPGVYDVEIKALEIEGRPVAQLTGIQLDGDSQIKRSHDFASGTLRVGAASGGQLVDAVVSVNNLDTNTTTASGRTYTSPTSNPKAFELAPGRYRVQVKSVRPPGLAPQEITVEIKAGQTTEKKIELK